MSTDLLRTLESEKDSLARTLAVELASGAGSPYRRLSQDVVLTRARGLVSRSARRGPHHLAEHLHEIVSERIAEGFDLESLQRALWVLEERAWQVAMDHSTLRTLPANLTLVRRTLGRARDELARAYLAHARRAESAAGAGNSHDSPMASSPSE